MPPNTIINQIIQSVIAVSKFPTELHMYVWTEPRIEDLTQEPILESALEIPRQ